MITFAELRAIAPDIADPTAARFEKSVLGMLGTIRRDGSPRVSPIEVGFYEGRLFVGMMPGSTKSQDVERDPRVSLVTALADKDDLAGEGKLFGIAARVDDELAARFLQQHATEGGFDPEEVAGSPVYEILLTAAAWQFLDGESMWTTYSWTAADGLRRRRREGATGGVVDV